MKKTEAGKVPGVSALMGDPTQQMPVAAEEVKIARPATTPDQAEPASPDASKKVSQAGKAGLPGGATYCATKHAVVGLSEAVRLENIDKGIEVSCVMPAVVNTELGSGLVDTRGVKKLEPEEVAEAIVEAIETNRFDVWVPRSSAGIAAILSLVPRSGREAIARILKADKVLAEADEQERADYEDRAAKSTSEAGAGSGADAEQPATKG